jgi:hypothetical protein
LSDPETTAPERADEAEHEGGHPRGTLLLMLLFLIMIVGMWVYIYLMMLGRG